MGLRKYLPFSVQQGERFAVLSGNPHREMLKPSAYPSLPDRLEAAQGLGV